METNEVVEKLENKIKIPTDIKEKIYDKLFKIICMAILVLVYFIFLNLGYIKLEMKEFENDLHIFSSILIIATVIIFEMAYKKKSDEIALNGVELLVISIVTLFMPYVFFHRGNLFKFIYSIFSVYMAIYYLVKCTVIYIKEIKKYKASLSDIKEIIDDENKETYLNEKNERKFKEVE